jgi:hypothetical protein
VKLFMARSDSFERMRVMKLLLKMLKWNISDLADRRISVGADV